MPLLQYQMWHVWLQGTVPYKLGYEIVNACLQIVIQTQGLGKFWNLIFLNSLLCCVSLPQLQIH